MPELPEVEVTRRGLLAPLKERRIVAVSGSGKRLRTDVPLSALKRHVRGQRICTIDRRAKYLLFRLDTGAVMVVHLGMTGKLGLIVSTTPLARHDHLVFRLDDGHDLRFNDSRRFGSVNLWPPPTAKASEEAFSQQEGIEPFSETFTGEHLAHLTQSRSAPVKSILMNSALIAGVGNIYANETLFAAGVHPLTPASNLSAAQWQRIAEECTAILSRAIAAGGSTIADFLGASGNPGYFQLQLAVYGRKGEPCHLCRQPVEKVVLSGRATYFCPACQPLNAPG